MIKIKKLFKNSKRFSIHFLKQTIRINLSVDTLACYHATIQGNQHYASSFIK